MAVNIIYIKTHFYMSHIVRATYIYDFQTDPNIEPSYCKKMRPTHIMSQHGLDDNIVLFLQMATWGREE